jgi:putative oxidoreductase
MPHMPTNATRSVLLTVSAQQARWERSHAGRALVACAGSLATTARTLDHAVAKVVQPVALPVLRVALGLLFIWFGGLKVMGVSPVAVLVADTLPFADAHLVVLALGAAELALGLVLLSGRLLRVALPALALHLVGTFSTFAVVPHLMFRHGNPLLLTGDGEFVMKNLILIAATLVLIGHTSKASAKGHPGAAAPV